MLHNSTIRKALTSVFIILIGSLILSLIRNTKEFMSNHQIAVLSINSEDNKPIQASSVNSEIYVPSITISKGANFNSSDCSGFSFDYTVENTSDNGEVFINVQVTDEDIGGLSPIFVAGDDNNNNRLDPGEKWNYTAAYGITQDDINSDTIVTQLATVVADVQGQGIQVMDDTSSDAPTIIDLTPCQIASIGLRKTSVPIDLDMDVNNCAENFLYTFEVMNTGNLDLVNLILDDPLLGGEVPGPIPLSDVGNDGILSPNETWEYQALYSADLLASGVIRNQAEINAETVLGVPTSDFSHDSSYFEDGETPSPYDEVCTGAFARIGLIKTVSDSIDTDGDNCDDTIQYTFTVRNVQDAPLEEVVLTDPLLEGEITNRINNGDGDDILAPGETWLYEGEYMVTPEDIIDGTVQNQALVQAKLVGFDIFLFDYSDNNSFDENDETVEQVDDYCSTQRIGLLKRAGASDFLVDRDGDGCLESLHYEFTVTNTSGVDLDEVMLSDPKIPYIEGPQQDNNGDEVLSVGETWLYDGFYPLTEADLDAGQVENKATVRAEEVGTNEVYSDDSDQSSLDENSPTIATTSGVGICEAEANIGLLKPIGALVDLTNDGCPETIRYQFQVENLGAIDLQQVTLTDDNLNSPITGPTVDDGNDQILSVGEKWLFEASYAITDQDIQDGFATNRAEVTAVDRFFGNPVLDFSDPEDYSQDRDTETSTVGACTGARIGLIKSFNAPLQDLDGDVCPEIINYVLIVRNVGNIPLDQVVVDDPQLNNLLVGPQNDAANDEVLSPGEEWVFEAPYPITDQDVNIGSITNSASVSAFEKDTDNEVTDLSHDLSFDEDGNTTVIIACNAQAEIVLLKISDGTLDRNNDGCAETIEYEFRVRNTGEISLSSVSISDLDFVVTINGPNNDDGNGILSPNEEWIYLGYYSLTEQDINTMSVTNRAEVTAQDTFFNNSVTDLSDYENFALNRQTVTPTVGACFSESSIGLIKVASSVFEDVNNDGCPENIPYIFTINNTGSIPLQQVVLTDILLGPDPIDGPLPGNDINGDEILSPGETWTYLALYPITDDNIADTVVRNQANVIAFEEGTVNIVSDDSDDNSFDENDETITSVVGACAAEADITLTKNATPVDSDGDGCPETIRYSFIVDNTGAIDLNQVVINDALLINPISGPLNNSDINGDTILSISETWTYEAEYTITQTDYNEGFVTNQAQVAAFEVITNNQIEVSSEEVTTSFADVCEEPVDYNFEIFNGITPNGDGINDFFEIRGIENYPNNNLQVFNRWGVLVYETEGYGSGNNLFRGISSGRVTIVGDRELPSGTYFFILSFSDENPGQESYTGYLYINRD